MFPRLAVLALLVACSTPPPPPETSSCGARVCGSVGGKSCGVCEDDGVCASDGLSCIPAKNVGETCAKDLECGTGRLCLGGERVPGGYCTRRCSDTNPCPEGSTCLPGPTGENVCLAACAGADSCRISQGYACEGGVCTACVGSCTGRTCGDDGCGHACGSCDDASSVCDGGSCSSPYTRIGGMVDAQGRPDPRWDFAAFSNQNGQSFLVGGRKVVRDPDGNSHSGGVATVTRYDTVQRKFFAFAPLPEPIARPHAAILDDVMYVAGGINDSDDVSIADVPATGFYKQNGTAWLKLNQAPLPVASMHGAAEAVAGRLYLIPGDVNGVPSDAMFAYDPTRDAWSEAPKRPVSRSFFASASDGERLWVMGGWDGSATSARVDVFDPTSGWTRAPDLPLAVADAKTLVTGGRIFLFGGIDGPGIGDVRAVVQVVDLATRKTALLGTTYGYLFAQAPLRTRDGPGILFGGTELALGTFVPHDDVVTFRTPAP